MTGIQIIAAEREHQQEKGYTAESDAKHDKKELVFAAMAYMMPGILQMEVGPEDERIAMPNSFIRIRPGDLLPKGFDARLLKRPEIERLAAAGALIAAEIDRIQSEVNQC
jgi:hypothetical protein